MNVVLEPEAPVESDTDILLLNCKCGADLRDGNGHSFWKSDVFRRSGCRWLACESCGCRTSLRQISRTRHFYQACKCRPLNVVRLMDTCVLALCRRRLVFLQWLVERLHLHHVEMEIVVASRSIETVSSFLQSAITGFPF